MKNLKWIQDGQKYFLTNDETLLLTLNFLPAAGADFILNEKEYLVNQKGSWNPAYYVTASGKEIIKLTHSFWGSKGKIICWDDTVYKCEYINKGGLMVRFLDGENELLSYYLSTKTKQLTIGFSIGTYMEDAEKLLILAALGMVLFTSLAGENFSKNDDNSNLLLLLAAS
jgi:hypothetical protein